MDQLKLRICLSLFWILVLPLSNATSLAPECPTYMTFFGANPTLTTTFLVSMAGVLLWLVWFLVSRSRSQSQPQRQPEQVVNIPALGTDEDNAKYQQFICGLPVDWLGPKLMITPLSQVLGIGSIGTTYRVAVNHLLSVAVKTLEHIKPLQQEFEDQILTVGRVGYGHPNVAGIIGYHYTSSKKLIIYEYFEGGSLWDRLHGLDREIRCKIGLKLALKSTPGLDWEIRRKIGLRIARAIEHIHSFGPKCTHGNIKSSNILMRGGRDSRVVVSEMGLVPLLNNPPSCADGYVAPEALADGIVSQKGDVYSFGVLLLELLTGKQPYQSPRRESMVNLPKWVDERLKAGARDLYDDAIRNSNLVQRSIVLQTALVCVSQTPDARPDIKDVVGVFRTLNV